MHMSMYYLLSNSATDGQIRPKNIGATNWENMYHLCILLVFISKHDKKLWRNSKSNSLFIVDL